MAKIMNVDYEAIPAQASRIRSLGEDLNSQITTAYSRIQGMHKYWYGKRYNSLVKSFNKIVPEINELLTLVVEEIPYALETIANNYSQADRGTNATAAQKTAPKKISTIEASEDVGMKFVTEGVNSVKTLVTNNFSSAKSKMESIGNTYSKIQWRSEASEAFKVKFQKLKTNINQSFDNIMSEFKTLMTQTMDDVQKAESSNTVQ